MELREVQVSGVQDLLTMIRLEVGELRETVERLEGEKEELGEQITEMRESIDELMSIPCPARSQGSLINFSRILLEGVRGSLEEVEREKNRLAKELLEVRAGNETLINNLKNALLQKEHTVQQQQKEEKEGAWAELAEELREKDKEVAVLKPALEAFEAKAKEDRDKQKAWD